MKYDIKAHPTMYNGVQYRSRLEARWAAFFDLIGWKHEYEPIDLPGWSPDFRVVFPCGHSECDGSHELLVEIKPYFDAKQFKGHPCMDYPYGVNYSKCIYPKVDVTVPPEEWKMVCAEIRRINELAIRIPADASAGFGANPEVSIWEMDHGAGGGLDCLLNWLPDGYSRLWAEAGNRVQWHPKGRKTKRQLLDEQMLKNFGKDSR